MKPKVVPLLCLALLMIGMSVASVYATVQEPNPMGQTFTIEAPSPDVGTGSEIRWMPSAGDESLGLASWWTAGTAAGTCADPLPISCGGTLTGDNSGYTNNIGAYDCVLPWNQEGPEVIYGFELAPGGVYSITASLSDVTAELHLFLPDPSACNSGQCLTDTDSSYGVDTVSGMNLLPGTYNLSVDGFNGATGSYSLSLACSLRQASVCSNPIPISCGDHVTADTTGWANLQEYYTCVGWHESGPEHIYELTLPAGSNHDVTAGLSALSADLDVFILDPLGCDAGQCAVATSYGNTTTVVSNLPPATYFVAVDGYQGAEGSYELDVTCTPTGTVTGLVVDTDFDGASAHDAVPGDGSCQDSQGRCTLRAAMEEANAKTGADTITFDSVVFAAPKTITVDGTVGALPQVTDSVTITASSVWDTTGGRPGVTIDGDGGSFSGLWLKADGCGVYGLHVTDFVDAAISVWSSGNTIGGVDTDQRNVLSDSGTGLRIYGSGGTLNVARNNYIGVTPAGDAKLPNATGVRIESGAQGNTIGGGAPNQGNVISGNLHEGVSILYAGTATNYITNNLIGLAADGSTPLGNDEDGIFIHEATRSQIVGNSIAHNKDYGVTVYGASTTGHVISRNSIHHNSLGGIALRVGGNGGIASPSITTADADGASGKACNLCVVELFSDSAGQGKEFEGQTTANSSGNWSYTGALKGPNITATNIDEGSANTSEFSAPYSIAERIFLPLVVRNH